ncbi:MAG: 50S ribosomal protein L11 [Candidatus Marsarchaeota archaeon]|nr:50S ribosomal protein L11 [Candidatus Marsarchaeota archaeon]MCL5102355.1 50S ribosomal protein L11 [Candidatus Marsarchaeota archaeon]
MSDVIINGLIEGGKATGGPPFGPALGPLGVNINAIVAEINKKTADFSGIKVPVKVIVDPATKSYKVEVGMPPTSALILKEIGVAAGAKAKDEVVGNISLEQVKKIAKSKEAKLYGKSMAERVNQVLGTCKSMGVNCENENPRAIIARIKSGELKL